MVEIVLWDLTEKEYLKLLEKKRREGAKSWKEYFLKRVEFCEKYGTDKK